MILSPDKFRVLGLMLLTVPIDFCEGHKIQLSTVELFISGRLISEADVHEDHLPKYTVEWNNANN